jgi:hypothetical protein
MVRRVNFDVMTALLQPEGRVHHQSLCTACEVKPYRESVQAQTTKEVAKYVLRGLKNGVCLAQYVPIPRSGCMKPIRIGVDMFYCSCPPNMAASSAGMKPGKNKVWT